MAAFVGAGAKPDFLIDTLSDLDFTRFLRPPEAETSADGVLPRFGFWVLRQTPFQTARDFATIARWGGLHSSIEIEHWVDDQLARLVPDARRPVRFKDLFLPTYVVATDLQRSEARVWSTFDTPEASVAFAVRCSCSIPAFFQPVRQGDNRFVDGGLLSNLPAFVFAPQVGDRPLETRVLAFRLTTDYALPPAWSPLETARRVGNAVVDGATDLQTWLQPDVHVVDIPTPGLKATDFLSMSRDVVRRLVDGGRQRTQEFIDNELINLTRISHTRSLCADDDDVNSLLVARAGDADEVIVALPNAEWIWRLFPTVLCWKLRESPVSVKVLLAPNAASDPRGRAIEAARRRLLTQLGLVVREVEALPLRGFILNGTDRNRPSAIVYLTRDSAFLPKAVCYDGPEHAEVVRTLHDKVWPLLYDAPENLYRPELRPFDPARLCNQLKKGVVQYRSTDIQMARVEIGTLLMVVRYVREWKYRQMDRLIGLYQNHGFDLFAPICVQLKDGDVSIAGPPVVEEIAGNRFAIIEGHTRSLHCRLNDVEQMRCVVVRGATEELPDRPVSIHYGGIISRRRPEKQWKYQFMRRIEEALHPVP